MDTRYDVDHIEKKQKQEIFCSALWFVFGVLLLVASIVSIFVGGKNPVLFVISCLCAITSLVLLFREKKNAKYGKLKTVHGTVKKVHLKVSGSNGILTTGYSGTYRARYSNYGRDIHSFTIYVDDGKRVRSYAIKDTAKAFDKYYEIGDEVLHIGGTRFPVKPKFSDRWLCPICGEFNEDGECACKGCKQLVLKDQYTSQNHR